MRRRQRSVRVTVAVALLGCATALVAIALPTQSPFWLSTAAVTAIVLSWAALRITWTEVLQSRRENAADRAAAANAYRELFTARAAEHAEFTSAMTERLAEAQLTRRDLEGLLAQAQDRAHRAEGRLADETQQLVDARGRVEELERALAGGVTDLVAWQEQHEAVAATRGPRPKVSGASGVVG